MKFKRLEIEAEKGSFTRIIKSNHTRRTIKAVIIGAAAGFIIYYLSEGRHLEAIIAGDILRSLLIGGIFGLFITNSPCARGRC